MKKRWSMVGLLILVGALAVTVAFSPSAALAKEFKYAGPPAFTVTYPGFWTQDSDNPNKVLYRTKQEGSIPIMEIAVREDLPAGTTLANIAQVYKGRIEKSQQTQATITSDKQATLKDGTPCNEAVLTWVYQGFLNLQSSIVSVIKDGKWVYVVIHQSPGAPLWDAPRSLTFKK
jgi:hypothetical protein